MIRVVVIEPDGAARAETIEPVLAEFQRLVGGYIEGCPMKDKTTHGYVNETGLLDRLPINRRASRLSDVPHPLVGPIVVFGGYDDEGYDLAIPDDAAAALLGMVGGAADDDTAGTADHNRRIAP